MKHHEGSDRREQFLIPASIDQYVSADNPVRIIDAFVNGLNLQILGFKQVIPQKTGRPPYHPGDLLKLFIYGYMNRIRSTRPLEKQTTCNLEVMWLLKGITPDFKTIARFRRENADAIEKTFEVFVEIGVKRNFFGKALACVDGTRLKAVNNWDQVYSKEELHKAIARIKQKLPEYLRELDESDAREEDPEAFTEEEIREKIAGMEEELKKLQEAGKKLEESGDSKISLTDPDSRPMSVGSKSLVGYNAQIAVEAESKLIVAVKMTNDRADANNLFDVSSRAKEGLQTDSLTVLGDTGYHDSEEIKKCLDNGITPYVPAPACRQMEGRFSRDSFVYDQQTDQYRCPAGQTLFFVGNRDKGQGRMVRAYETKYCRQCSLKPRCTINPKGRVLERKPYEDVLEAMAERVKKHPRLMRKRKAVVEHVFGCIKAAMGFRDFLTKGLRHVLTEFLLAALAFNLKRLINDRGTQNLIKAIC